MPAGKLAAQAGHAYTNALLNAIRQNPTLAECYETPGQIGTKVCLYAKTLSQLLHIRDKAEYYDVPFSLITDSGHVLPPHFDGEPIVTALGIGPVTSEEAKKLTKKLRLVE